MSCKPKGYGQKNSGWRKPVQPSRWEKLVGFLFVAALTFMCAYKVSTFWLDDQGAKPKKNWKQMSGNDGKFWKGTPDNSVYSTMEGVRLTEYFQYFYDSKDRLEKVNTFRHHDYYKDVWVLSNEETYEYDSQGRVIRRQEVQGDGERIYEYTQDGCTESESSYSQKNGFITRYDPAGNQIYFRNAVNYRFPHVTTCEYDEKNRLVKKMLEVEGKAPYGMPSHVILSIEYDEKNYTAVETEYDSAGEVTHIWFSTYDESWNKTGSTWYAPESVPKGYSPEECEDYYTKGYWISYSGGRVLEEMSNEPWKSTRNSSEYTAYDYDGSGNCIMELRVYGVGYAYLYRYVYDGRNRLTEEYSYNIKDVKFWEQLQWDGSRLTLQVSDDESMSITRTGPDGTLINRFVYGEWEVDVQYTPTETIYWQRTPALILADKGPKPDETRPGGTEPGEARPPGPALPEEPKDYVYIVQKGDCLWSIAEDFLGDGREYMAIYRKNRDVIGGSPRLILPGMRLYIEIP